MLEHIRGRVKPRRPETARPARVGLRRASGSLHALSIPHPEGCGQDAQQIYNEIKVALDRGFALDRGLISPDAHRHRAAARACHPSRRSANGVVSK